MSLDTSQKQLAKPEKLPCVQQMIRCKTVAVPSITPEISNRFLLRLVP